MTKVELNETFLLEHKSLFPVEKRDFMPVKSSPS